MSLLWFVLVAGAGTTGGGPGPVSAELSADLEMYLNGVWENVTSDVRAELPIALEYGINGTTPNDVIADSGTLEFALDNSTNNSGGKLGYYSPLHSNRRSGFQLNVPVRWRLAANGNARYKFRGSLSDIVPTPGVHEDRMVHCAALDWMDDAARLVLPDLPVQLNKRPDELVTLILNALPVIDQPVARSIDTGSETYSIALDGGAAGSARPTVREMFNQIALSEAGKVLIKGDDVTGGVLTFENRGRRSANPVTLMELDDTEMVRGGLSVPGSRDDIYSAVQVFVKPTKIDTTAGTVLYALQTTTTLVPAASTNDQIFGPYRDPISHDQIGGTEQITPAAYTDYTMNAAADGSGSDLTGNFTVTASYSGLGVRWTLVNSGPSAYITKLQLRGKGIYRYTTVIDIPVPSGFGTRVFQYDMPLQNNINVASDVGTAFADRLSVPFGHVPSVRFLANNSQSMMDAAILREPGDRVGIKETVTGVQTVFTINSVRLELHRGSIQTGWFLWCSWGLEPASTESYWKLGITDVSELGTTTILGF